MKCSYCKRAIEPGRGVMQVKSDGKQVHLCSSKCAKNLKLKRKPDNLKWVTSEKKAKKE